MNETTTKAADWLLEPKGCPAPGACSAIEQMRWFHEAQANKKACLQAQEREAIAREQAKKAWAAEREARLQLRELREELDTVMKGLDGLRKRSGP